ncbi:MAG: TonB-dependent receptor, partial [Bacteroidota bacterium]
GSKRGTTTSDRFTSLFDPSNPISNPDFDTTLPISETNAPTLANVSLPNGVDDDPFTAHDSFTRYASGNFFEFDITHSYLSGSLGLNWKLDDETYAFFRTTRGVKAPDLDYYLYNFDNVPVDEANAGVASFDDLLETVTQSEVGVKMGKQGFSFLGNLFFSNLNNVPYTAQTVSTSGSFVTPTTFNKLTTFGLETELVTYPIERLRLSFSGTLQRSRWNQFSYFDVDAINFLADRGIEKNPTLFNQFFETIRGAAVTDLPNVFAGLSTSYLIGKLDVGVKANYTGRRAFNVLEAAYAPGFVTLDVRIQASLGQLQIALDVQNATNTLAFTHFSSYLGIGLNRESLSSSDLQALSNANRPVLGTPILPRFSRLSFNYRF